MLYLLIKIDRYLQNTTIIFFDMRYRYSHIDKNNMDWMRNDISCATLLSIKLTEGHLRGIFPFEINFSYPISVIAGENGSGKSTLLAMTACAYHNDAITGYALPDRKRTYYTFSDFFIQSFDESSPSGITIFYQILHSKWKGGKVGPGWQIRKKRIGGKWSNYDRRVKRNVIYFGVNRVVPHYERSTHSVLLQLELDKYRSEISYNISEKGVVHEETETEIFRRKEGKYFAAASD